MKTIMIIENNEAYHNIYKAMLEGLDYKFIHTYDGYEAMERMDETVPDMIILDMLMDMITGDTFFMYLRNVPEYTSIPVIIISSASERRYHHLRIADPGLTFIEKRFLTREKLIEEIDKKLHFPKNTSRVIFKLPEAAAPDAKRVCVVGDFNNWNYNANPMKKLNSGEYALEFELERGREYQFRYLIDRTKWINDINANKYVESPYKNIYNSVIVIRN